MKNVTLLSLLLISFGIAFQSCKNDDPVVPRANYWILWYGQVMPKKRLKSLGLYS